LPSSTSAPAASINLQAPPGDSGRYYDIPVELIDEPEHAMRETMDDTALGELCESIAKVGVIQPLVLERNGSRYRVVAGHRRLLAVTILKHATVPCVVREPGSIDKEAVTVAENYYREDVNPAEEALFLERLLETKCGGDIEVLAALIRHRVEYIDDRLLLLRGEPAVLDALREKKISLAVARELNRVKDPGRKVVYLDAAIRGGATAAVVRQWRIAGDDMPSTGVGNGSAPTASTSPSQPAPSNGMECFFCGDADEPHLIEVLYLHRMCKKFLTRILNKNGPAAEKGVTE
jgi:ParB/RepB/Spo0J family partition protein